MLLLMLLLVVMMVNLRKQNSHLCGKNKVLFLPSIGFGIKPFSCAYCSHLSSSSAIVNQRSRAHESSSLRKSQYN